jgi:uncharacterized protein YjaG (DUF416 family)
MSDLNEITEQEAKEQLGIGSWDQLSENEYERFIQILPSLSEQTLQRVLKHIPDVVSLTSGLVSTITRELHEKDADTTKQTLISLQGICTVIDRFAGKENLTTEDLRIICETLRDIAGIYDRLHQRTLDASDRKHKRVIGFVSFVLCAIAALIGVRYKSNSDGSDHRV